MPAGLDETLTTVQRIAAFSDRATAADMTAESRRLLKRNVLDSVGCAIAALPGPPFRALRAQFEDYRSPGGCTLIGGGTTSADQAALFNSGLIRYVDLLDSFMSPGGLCHPSDNLGAILAVAEGADARGDAFLLALAVAYEVQCRFTEAVPVMAKGFNHALQLAMSVAAGAGKLLGLPGGEIANAVAIAAVDNVSLACVHAEPVSQWKGFSPGLTAMRAVYATSLAKRGFTGPLRLFEGPNGLERMFGQGIVVDWNDPALVAVERTVLKKFCSLIHGQPVLEAVLDLKRAHGLAGGDVARTVCEIFQSGYDIAGGGSFGAKDAPRTKEQADYNLKYLIAAALLDGQVGPAQLEPARVNAPDAQDLLARVDIRPDDELSARYPGELVARVTIQTRDGRELRGETRDYEGSLARPMSWDRVVDKFHWLSEPYAGRALRERIVEVVGTLEERPVSDLVALLSTVEREPAFPHTSPGIQ